MLFPDSTCRCGYRQKIQLVFQDALWRIISRWANYQGSCLVGMYSAFREGRCKITHSLS